MFCEAMRQRAHTFIQKLTELIGKLCADFSCVALGPLHYRALEVLKCAGLKLHMGNFDGIVGIIIARRLLQIWIGRVVVHKFRCFH